MGRELGCAAALCSLIAACGGGDSKPAFASGTNAVEVAMGKRGGLMELEDAARISVPEGALEMRVTLRAEKRDLEDLPQPDAEFEAAGEPLVVRPHGLELRMPATIEQVLVGDATNAAEGELRVLRLDNEDDDTWEPIRRQGSVEVLEPGERHPDTRELASASDTLTDERRVVYEVDGFSVLLPVRVLTQPDGLCVGQEAGFECRPSAGACDVAETCDGESPDCPADEVLGTDSECRPSAGACDVAESCDGESAACPADAVLAQGQECRPAEGECDAAEVCDGESAACPANAVLAQGTVCRAAAGICDVVESCDGASAACPADTFVAAQTECRAATGECDPAEACTGSSAQCPQDAFLSDGTTCTGTPACAVHLCSSGTCTQDQGCPIFVNANGGVDQTGCGTSWANACASLAQANAEAASAGNGRVFVAVGRYQTAGAGSVLTMAEATAYYGGFAGSENSPTERGAFSYDAGVTPDAAAHSILGGNGSPDPIVVGASGGRLDGFTLMDMDGGVASGDGMHNAGDVDAGVPLANLTVANTRFYGESTASGGGRGMYNEEVQGLRVENTLFDNNEQGTGDFARGSGMQVVQGDDVTLTDTQFVQNTLSVSGTNALGGALATIGVSQLRLERVAFDTNHAQAFNASAPPLALGGALYSASSNQTLVDVTFDGNFAYAAGEGNAVALGGALLDVNTSSTLTNVSFNANSTTASYSAGGGAYLVDASESITTTLTNVSFTGNGANGTYLYGGAMQIYDSAEGGQSPGSLSVSIDGSRFEDNGANGTPGLFLGGALYAGGTGVDLSLTRSVLESNQATSGGGGLYAEGATVTLQQTSFANNEAGAGNTAEASVSGGGAMLVGGSASIHNSQFTANAVTAGGVYARGGGIANQGSALIITDSDFVQNSADLGGGAAEGGGLYHEGAASLTITNVGFVGNKAGISGGSGVGGGMFVQTSAGTYLITNASFVDNTDGIYAVGGAGEIDNSILANDGDQNLIGVSPPTSSHRCTTTPEIPLVTDTTLTDPATELLRTRSGHVYLPAGSPCLDAGDDTAANTGFGGNAWASLTTRLDGTLDVSPVDAGRHYDVGALAILTFEENPDDMDTNTDLDYAVRAPAGSTCTFANFGDPGSAIAIDPVASPAGTLVDPGLDTVEAGVVMRCETPDGAVAQSFLGGAAANRLN